MRRKTKKKLWYSARLGPDGQAEAITQNRDGIGQWVPLRHERVSYQQDTGELQLTFTGRSLVRKGEQPKFWELSVQYPECLIQEEEDDEDDNQDLEDENRGCKYLEYLTRENAEKGFARELAKITDALKRCANFFNSIDVRASTVTWQRVKPSRKFGEPEEILETREL